MSRRTIRGRTYIREEGEVQDKDRKTSVDEDIKNCGDEIKAFNQQLAQNTRLNEEDVNVRVRNILKVYEALKETFESERARQIELQKYIYYSLRKFYILQQCVKRNTYGSRQGKSAHIKPLIAFPSIHTGRGNSV